MKIVHVARQFVPSVGGVENVIFNLASRQVLLGHDVTVVTLNRIFSDGSKLSKNAEIKGIKIRRMPYLGSKRYPIAPWVLRYIDESDLIHVHCVDYFLDFLSLMKWWHRKKIILHTHGGFFHTKWFFLLKKIYFFTITRLALKKCEIVIAVSESDRSLFTKISSKVVLVENGVDVEKFGLIRKDVVKGKLICVGRLDSHKRLDNLVRLMAVLKQRVSHEIILEILGPDSEKLTPKLKKMARELHVEELIIWRGKVSDDEVLSSLAKAQLFLSASEYEGFGISAVEAMASGTMCLLNNIEAFKKILGPDSELLVDFNDTNQTVGKLVEIMSWPNEKTEYVSRKLKITASKYSWDSAVERIDKIYTGCVS